MNHGQNIICTLQTDSDERVLQMKVFVEDTRAPFY